MSDTKNAARGLDLEALSAEAERFGLTPSDLDALRDLRSDPEEHARRLLYREHYGDVRAHAADIMRDILSGSIADPDALGERLHEEADGSRAVFVYAGALRTVYASENWDAGPEELGFEDFASGVQSVPELMTRAAYWALRTDLRERLGLFVSHPPEPGSEEARELGFDRDSLGGLDLDDADTYPANRSEEDAHEACECSDPGCACGGTCAERATATLRRVDFAGEPECSFCEDCAADALASGVFAGSEDEAPEEEPAPGDYVVSSNGFRLSVGIVEGAHVGDFAEHAEAEDAIREHRARTSPQFFPEVWSVSDHGNVSRYAEEGFPWDPPAPELDREAVETAAARTAFVLAWADAEERDGRTYPGSDLDEVAPDFVPGRFRAWARDVISGALGATTRGDGIAEAWARADAETLGRALALSCGGWTDGLGEADLPHPIGLPHLDADGRLHVEPSEFRADPPSVEELQRIAGRAEDPAGSAERILASIEHDSPEDALAMADAWLHGFGVESLDLPAPDDDSDAGTVRYVNLGDTYTATLCYVEDARTPGGRFVVSDWGTLLEQAEEERTYSTGEVRCPNCGDWTGAGSLDSEEGCNACGYGN